MEMHLKTGKTLITFRSPTFESELQKADYSQVQKSFGLLWWVCDCRSKCVVGAMNSLTSPEIFPHVLSFAFISWNVSFPWETFLKEAMIPIGSQCFKFAVTLAASRPEDVFIDLTANSTVRVMILSTTVKIFFWILSLTNSMILLFSLSILSVSIFAMIEQSPHSHWLLEDCHHY